MKMKFLILVLLLAIPGALAAGYFLGDQPQTTPPFHNLRINPATDYVALIDPTDPAIRQLAANFRNYEDAYRFVRDKINFVPFAPPGPVGKTLEYAAGSCLGKAALLCSLYRAMGMPAADARIVMGIVMIPQGQADHVWIDLEHQGECLQQDPSGLLGRFNFYEFPGARYVDSFVVKETFCFNENGFAIVSQLNRFRDNPLP